MPYEKAGPAARGEQLFYEDVAPGDVLRCGAWRLTNEEIASFAERWDPFEWHVDAAAAERGPFGCLIAAGVHLMAVKQRLLHDFPLQAGVICTTGFDEVRFLSPGRAGDLLFLRLTWIEKRPSRSKPDRGLVMMFFELETDSGRKVLTFFDTILMRRRDGLPLYK